MQVARLAKSSLISSAVAAIPCLLVRGCAHSLSPRPAAACPGFDGDGGELGLRGEQQRVADGWAGGGGDWELCGRGDKRTKKGKRFKGSFGKCRPKKNWDKLREKWEIPAGPAPGSLLPRTFPPLLAQF